MKCLLIPESTLPSQNIPLFKHLYEALPEFTLPYRIYLLLNIYMWPSQNVPLPPRIYIPLLNILDLYATLQESTPPSQNIPAFYIKRTPRIYSPLFSQLCATLPWSSPPSQNIPPPPFLNIFTILPESTPPSLNIWLPLQTSICDSPRIYPSLPEEIPTFLVTHSKQYRFFSRNLSVLSPCNPRRTLAWFSWGCMVIVLKGSFWGTYIV